MGSALSSSPKKSDSLDSEDHHPYSHPSTQRKSYSADISKLREMVRRHSKLILLEKYVFLLYSPPNFPEISMAEYISERVNIPIYPIADMDYLLHEIETNQNYQKGLIVCQYSSKFEDVDLLRRHIEAIGMKLCIFFFEMDGQTLGNTLDKFDRWVTPSSNRSYHLSSSPPKSFLLDHSRMVDDVTGEMLIKLPEDTAEYYTRELRNSREKQSHLYFLLYSLSYVIPGGATTSDTQRLIDQTLYSLIVGDINRKSGEESAYSSINTTHSDPV